MLFVKPSIHSKLPATSQATQLQNRTEHELQIYSS